jgi:hypothetical protein
MTNKDRADESLVQQMVPLATGLVVLYALLGAAMVIISAVVGDVTEDLRLSFKDYLQQMATAIAGLAIGRGILANAKKPS